jgi:murein DD-endopeptidase
MALYAATGLLIRTTADDLYKRVFTVKNPGREMIRAAFFLEGVNGKAAHVAALVDNEVVLNSQEGGARVRGLEELRRWFGQRGKGMAVRGLDRGALEKLAGAGNTRYGIDGEFERYFE